VGFECRVGFFLDGVGQTIGANHDHGVQVMRFGAVIFALGRGKDYLGHM
jgi:hypothetical protein